METQKSKKPKRRGPKSKITLMLLAVMVVFLASVTVVLTKGIIRRGNALSETESGRVQVHVSFVNLNNGNIVTQDNQVISEEQTIWVPDANEFKFRVNPNNGFTAKVTIDGQDVTNADNEYSTIVLKKKEIIVEFVAKPKHSINFTVVGNGSVSDSTQGIINGGTVLASEGKYTFTAVPTEGNAAYVMLGDKRLKSSDNNYTFDLKENVNVLVAFSKDYAKESKIQSVVEGDKLILTAKYMSADPNLNVKWMWNALAYDTYYNFNYYDINSNYTFAGSNYTAINNYAVTETTYANGVYTSTLTINNVNLKWDDYAFIFGHFDSSRTERERYVFTDRFILDVKAAPYHDYTIIEHPSDLTVGVHGKSTFTAKFANTGVPNYVGWQYSKNGGTVWYDCAKTGFGTIESKKCPSYNGTTDKCSYITTLTIDDTSLAYDNYQFRAYVGEVNVELTDEGYEAEPNAEEQLYNKTNAATLKVDYLFSLDLGMSCYTKTEFLFPNATVNTKLASQKDTLKLKELLVEIKNGPAMINYFGLDQYGLTVTGDASRYVIFKSASGMSASSWENFITSNINFTTNSSNQIKVRFILGQDAIRSDMIGQDKLDYNSKYGSDDATFSTSDPTTPIEVICNDYVMNGTQVTYPDLDVVVPPDLTLNSMQVQLTSKRTTETITCLPYPGFTIKEITTSNYVITKDDGSAITNADFQKFLRENVIFNLVEGTKMGIKWTVSTGKLNGDYFFNIENGHYYKYVYVGNVPWVSARASAKQYTYLGMQGYLATVRDESEDAFLSSILPKWIMGYWVAGGVNMNEINRVLPNGYYFGGQNPQQRTEAECINMAANINRFTDPENKEYWESLMTSEIPAGSNLGGCYGIWFWLEGPEAGQMFYYQTHTDANGNFVRDDLGKAVPTYVQRFNASREQKNWSTDEEDKPNKFAPHQFIHYAPVHGTYTTEWIEGSNWRMCTEGHDYVPYMIVEFGGMDGDSYDIGRTLGIENDTVEWYGWIEINKTDNEKNTSLEGITFGIYKDSACTNLVETLVTDANGHAKSKGIAKGTYYVKEISTKNGYLLSTDVTTAIVAPTKTITLNLKNQRVKGRIEIHKIDNETKQGLEGVTYEVYARENITHPDGKTGVMYTKDQLVATIVTNRDGIAVAENLYLGKYYVREKATRNGYLINTQNYNIDLNYQGDKTAVVTASKTIENQRVKGTIQINKVCNETHNGLEGVTYEIYARENIVHPDGVTGVLYRKDQLVTTITTNYDGVAKAENLYLGKYYIKEKATRVGYLLGLKIYDVELKYKDNRTAVIKSTTRVEDQRVKGKITINKLDKEANAQVPQGDASLDGAVYGLYAREDIIHPDGKTGVLYTRDSLVKTGITANGGKVVFDELYLGRYYIKEITPSEGYLLDPTVYEVTLAYKNDRTPLIEKTTTSKEQVKKQPFTFTKGSVKSNALLPGSTSSLQVLENAGFSVYLISDLSKVKDGTIRADVDGNYNVNDIIKAYFNNETLTYDFRNEKKAVVYNENGENGKLTQIEGNKYEVSELFSDKTGKVSSPELPYGKYVVVETTVPDNYPNEYFMAEPIIVTISEDSREEKLPDDDVFAVINYPFNAKIKITKMDSETKKAILKVGAKYRIYNMDTNSYVTQIISYPEHVEIGTEENPYAVNDKGELLTPETLPVGHYRLEEVAAPYGYVLQGYESEEKAKVEFYIRKESDYEVDTEDDKLYVVVKVVQENDPQVGELKIVKEGEKAVVNRVNNGFFSRIARALFGGEEEISYSYNKGKIEGAEFEIYVKETIYTPDNQRDEAGNRIVNTYNGVRLEKDALVGRIRTNENGEAIISRLPLGKYYVKEVVAGEGYVLNKEIKEMEFTYQGEKVAVVYKDTGYLNERQKAEISILKVDEITGEPLEGAEFGLYKREGEEDKYKYVLIEKVVTNAGGSAKFSADIPHGRYYIKETKAPEGYELIESYQEVNFQYRDQEVAVVKFEREFRDDLIRTPNKTVDIGDGTETDPGAILTYTVNYKNRSNVNEKLRITDVVPVGTKYVAGYATASVKGKDVLSQGMRVIEPEDGSEQTTITWESEDFVLKPNEKISVTFKVRVKTIEEGLEVDKVTNKAKVVHGEDIDVKLVKDSYKVKYYKDNIVTGEFLGEYTVDADLGSVIPWNEINKNLFRPEGYKEGVLLEDESARIVVRGDSDIVYIVYKAQKKEPDSYIVRYYKDNIVTGEYLGEERIEAETGSTIPWDEIDKNLKRPEGYEEGELQEKESATVVIKGDDDIVYIVYKTEEKVTPPDSYIVRYYKDSIDDKNILGEYEVDADVNSTIPWDQINKNLLKPEGYHDGEIQEGISSRVVIEGDGDVVYILYVPEAIEEKEGYTVKYYKDSIDDRNLLGEYIVEADIDTAIPWERIDKNLKRPYKYKEGVLQEDISANIVVAGDSDIVYILYLPEKTGIKDSYTVKYYKDDVETGEYLGEQKFEELLGEIIEFDRVDTELKRPEGYGNGILLEDISATIVVEGDSDIVYVVYKKLPHEDETNEVENPVKVPTKTVDIGNGTGVLEGETLTYAITYKNVTEHQERFKIRDSIPEGAKYVAGSMTLTINGEDAREKVAMKELEDMADEGELTWESNEGVYLNQGDIVRATFKVVVKTREEGLKVDEIKNKGTVGHGQGNVLTEHDTNEVENPVKNPSKSVDVGNKTQVKMGETLTYTVRYKNISGEAEKVIVTDAIPEGTKYVAGSMTAKIGETDGIEAGRVEIEELEDGAKKGTLTWKCAKLEIGEEIEVTFKVVVLTEEEGLKVDEIRNIAEVEHTGLVSGKKIKDPTNEVENPVLKPEIPDVPDTSDISLWLYVAIVIVALCGICYAVITNKKGKNNKSTK